MSTCLLPSLEEVYVVFAGEVSERGGSLIDTVKTDHMLFLRATFPASECVQPQDSVNLGVALRAVQEHVDIHPYVFRQVCRNGAILSQVTDMYRTRRVEHAASEEQIAEVLEDVRVAVESCADPQSLQHSVKLMQRSLIIPGEVELLINIAALFGGNRQGLLHSMLQSFESGRDRSQFGIMNAVTAVARDTRDPETRWRLEELGGGILARLSPGPSPLHSAALAGCR